MLFLYKYYINTTSFYMISRFYIYTFLRIQQGRATSKLPCQDTTSIFIKRHQQFRWPARRQARYSLRRMDTDRISHAQFVTVDEAGQVKELEAHAVHIAICLTYSVGWRSRTAVTHRHLQIESTSRNPDGQKNAFA